MKNIYQEAILQSMTEIEANSAGRGFDNTYNNGRTSAFTTAIEIIKSNLSLAEKKEKAQQAATASFGKFWDAVREMNDAVKQLSAASKKQFPSGGIAPNGPEVIVAKDGSQREAHIVRPSLAETLNVDWRAKYAEPIFKLNDGDLNHFSYLLKDVLLNGTWNVDIKAKLKSKSDKFLDEYSIKRYGVKYDSLAIPNKRQAVQRAAFAATEKMYLEEFDKIQRRNSNLEEQLCIANQKIAQQHDIFKELKVECGKLETNVVEIEKNVDFWVEEAHKLKIENDYLKKLRKVDVGVMKAYQETHANDMDKNAKMHQELKNLRIILNATPNVFGNKKPNQADKDYQKKTIGLNNTIAFLLAFAIIICVLASNGSLINIYKTIASWF